MNNSDKTQAELYQFKNASHFGVIMQHHLLSPSSNTRQDHLNKLSPNYLSKDIFSNFNFFNKTNSEKNVDNKFRQSLEGRAVTLDDEGNVLFAEWFNNKVNGKYFLFKSNLVEESNENFVCSGICQYGNMKDGNLEGENYIYNISGTIGKGTFFQNKLVGKCYLVHSNNSFINSIQTKQNKAVVDCVVLNFDQTHANYSQNVQINKQFEVKYQQQQINSSQFIKPVQFLKLFCKQTQQQQFKNNSSQFSSLKDLQINQHDFFFGFARLTKKQQINQKINEQTNYFDNINGFGLILRDSWPLKSGNFEKGKLNGLCRIYETQLTICDGNFTNNIMNQGFIIDFYNNQISYGKNTSAVSSLKYSSCSYEDENQFCISETYDCFQFSKILDFKKQQHLKSLYFNNNYLTFPKLVNRSPWPLTVISQLFKEKPINKLIKSFTSAHGYSLSSQRKITLTNSEQKQRIQEKNKSNQHKQFVIKQQIYNHLQEKRVNPSLAKNPIQFNQYINQYNFIQKRRRDFSRSQQKSVHHDSQQSASNFKDKAFTPKKYQQSVSKYFQPSKNKHLSSLADHLIQKQKQKNSGPKQFSLLIEEYHQYQKNGSSKKQSDLKYQPRAVNRKSQMIQLDHKDLKDLNTKSNQKIVRKSSGQNVLNLDNIYSKYLRLE